MVAQAKRNPKWYGMPTSLQSEQAFGMAMHNKFTLTYTKELAQHGLVGAHLQQLCLAECIVEHTRKCQT